MTAIIEPDRSKWDHSGEKPIKIVCSHCESDDVRRDAFASWDLESQTWVLAEVYDDGHCNKCEGSARLEEEELEEGTYLCVNLPTT